jgi:aspartate/methionine/tyrosine aminotransferase
VYADVEHLTRAFGGDSMQLCTRWLHELGVASTPGLDFDLARGEHTVRFSYAGRGTDLVRACERVAQWTP